MRQIILYYTGIIIIASGCKRPEIVTVENTSREDSIEIKLPVPKDYYKIEGFRELTAFKNRYESKWKTKPQKFPYSKLNTIKVFKLDCMGECLYASFNKRISKGKEISIEDFNMLIKLLRNPDSYNQSTAGCHDPKFGLILYDEEGVATEYLDICLSCNRFSTYPGDIKVKYKNEFLYGFSKETRNKLRSLFAKWGIDYQDTSTLFD